MIRGFLILQDNGRFGVVTRELTCGTPVEVFINGYIVAGTIEYRTDWETGQGEYYLLSDDKTAYTLTNDMEILLED